ncbi:hypothetical protein SAMN05216249_10936 [Acetitomaculum ruminis DSM 5522]|uniref:37-kD nucleoid-associated bacterial protein n=1 Tax=Acetitomaculum ruminis DSM 5522 TaxID=1120918 RepID=A0A1I0Y8M6_9FIRM|nr:hypothetical protein [Acetitomaculum ruminis]SFB09765.1 hypothetical protein SAMN05216249_10936 [Acetitomaculum ruminis DSM 5522]
MDVLFKSYQGIDVLGNRITDRDINEEFDQVISEMLEKILGNKSEKRYEIEHAGAEVAGHVENIAKIVNADENAEEQYKEYAVLIANRLLREERRVQERMEHLNGVQKGSLIQALLRSDGGKTRYLIAKVEHLKYVDENDLVLKAGFNPEENKIWKTAIFDVDIFDDEIEVTRAKIYLDHKAVYWTDQFLELTQILNDEVNTRRAWKAIEGALKSNLQKTKPSDYFALRNAVITYFRRPRVIDYNNMLDDIFNHYEPIDASEDDIKSITELLLELPEKKNFDTNFTSKPAEIKAKIKSVFKVNSDVELVIKAGVNVEDNNISSMISTNVTPEGKRQIVITTTDDDTFNTFRRLH